MRIGLNLLHAMPEVGGAWNYIARLVAALAEWDRRNTYVAFVTARSACLVPPRPNFEVVQTGVDASSRGRRVLFENTRLQSLARTHRVDVMHWFANAVALVNVVPSVVTVYDLMVLEDPRHYTLTQRVYLRALLPHTARHATLLLPMSETTAEGLGRTWRVPRQRLVVVPAVVGDSFRPVGEESVVAFRRRHGLPDRFWLYVAHFYAHKNHERLLRAYAQLRSAGEALWPLVLRGDDHGAEAATRGLVAELGLQGGVVFLPRVEEDALPVLYSAASSLVFPSLFEGGGIPVLEAMACGCPVVASDIPAVREFGDDAVERFDPRSLESIAGGIARFQADEPRRLACRLRGLERVRSHRADVVAASVIHAYELAAGPR